MQQIIGELGHSQPDIGILSSAISQTHVHPPPSPIEVMGHPGHMPRTGGGINELFYDPLGGIKHGQQIGAIGHHSDHVHVSLATEAQQKAAIQQARRMGLHVGEESNADVHPVHVKTSYHYQHYRKGDPLRKAADVSGNPQAMAAFYRWIAQNFG
jgi:hypothetical protein